MIVFIIIYLLSVVGMWCFYHFSNDEAITVTAGSLPMTLIPAINSITLILGIIYLLSRLDWDNISHKFFNIK